MVTSLLELKVDPRIAPTFMERSIDKSFVQRAPRNRQTTPRDVVPFISTGAQTDGGTNPLHQLTRNSISNISYHYITRPSVDL